MTSALGLSTATPKLHTVAELLPPAGPHAADAAPSAMRNKSRCSTVTRRLLAEDVGECVRQCQRIRVPGSGEGLQQVPEGSDALRVEKHEFALLGE